MFFSTWRQCLSHYIRTVGPKNRQRTPRPAFIWRPGLEHLEDRISPATDITVVLGAAGTGNLDHFLSATNGTITTADDPGDTAATLSVGALTAIGSAVAISIAADNSITFNDLVSLNLPNAAGVTAAFSTTSGPISFDSLTDTLYTAGGAEFQRGHEPGGLRLEHQRRRRQSYCRHGGRRQSGSWQHPYQRRRQPHVSSKRQHYAGRDADRDIW